MTARSYLYVPGDAPDKLAKALTRGADALIVDLEDAVPAAGKDAAREAVASWLSEQDRGGAVELWVRVNPGGLREPDVRAVVAPALTGVCVAKTASREELVELDAVLSSVEREAGAAPGRVAVAPLLESAAAVLAAADIARAPRVTRLQVGEADLCAELGVTPGAEERELLLVRSAVVLASGAAGIDPPVGPVSTDFRDLDRLRASTQGLARLGYRGRACIHPAQLAVVHEVFTPSADQVDAARRLVERFEESVASGAGVLVGEDGRMVDEAVVRAARRTLATAR